MFSQRHTVDIYDTVPDGLITVLDAANEYHVTNTTIYRWIREGRLSEAGLLRVAPSGHKNVILLETRLVQAAAIEDEETQAIIYHELPEHLVTFSDASRRYDVKVATLRSWIGSGYIVPQGKLRGGPGRAKTLLDPRDIERMLGGAGR